MPTDPASLLPPGASHLEVALERATARVGAVETPLAPLWNPATCPIALLPWLAWALSVDTWDAAWSEETKRQAVADSIELHRLKGTRWAVETVAQRHDALCRVVEWFEAEGSGTPHTFQVMLPMVTAPGVAAGGDRATAAFAEKVMADIVRVKPLREHLEFVQSIDLFGLVGIEGAARFAGTFRNDADLTVDLSPQWDAWLQTEQGEPIETEDGELMDDTL